ncbi:MAG: transglutaminase family protein [Rikenellaceae bacterium]
MRQIKRYKFSYQTIVTYRSMVWCYHFMLRCTPREESFQRLKEHQLHLMSPAVINSDKDVFGNTIHYGFLNEAHDIFVVSSNGVVECSEYKIEDSAPKAIYLAATHLTAPSAELSKFNASIDATGSPLQIAQSLSSALHNYMTYSAGATTITTTAAEGFNFREGVCQDFSHILIAMCRERAIFARYIVGFVVGTGQTHAWVEVWCDGVWYGVDPTHHRMVEDGYIKLAHGRDAADCSVVRGSKQGLALHITQIRVVVEEI